MSRKFSGFVCLVVVGSVWPLSQGCALLPKPAPPSGPKVEATPEAIERAEGTMKRHARAARSRWRDKGFTEFERSVYRERGEGGKYIVNGDTPIADRKQLEEFFNLRIKGDPSANRSRTLIVVAGEGGMWNSTQKMQLTYCVSTAFGSRHAAVVEDMENAAGAWESAANIDFIYIASQDAACHAFNGNVLFDVRPVNVNGEYYARAFFPDDARPARNVLIDNSSFGLSPTDILTLEGILRHELGHTLGWRHEHTRPEAGDCFEDNDWVELTDYDAFSVMHYPYCNGGGDWSLTLTPLDENGAACAYGPAPGFTIDPALCRNPPDDSSAPCGVDTHYFQDQRVSRGEEKGYDTFNVASGSRFEVRMVGSGRNAGDPDLYVRFGDAPDVAGRRYDCRPYLTGADESCSLDVPAGQTQAFVVVHGYAAGAYDLIITSTSG